MKTKPRLRHIYHLVDPNTKAVRYVGNSVNPRGRLRSHIKEAEARQNTAKKEWIKSLLDRQQLPVLVIVAEYSNEDRAREAESDEVRKHVKTITNLHDPRKGAKDIGK